MANQLRQKIAQVEGIENFLGINMSTSGATQLKIGESPEMCNFKITKDYKLEKMYGYKKIFTGTAPIRYIGRHKIGATNYLIVVTEGKIYKIETFEELLPLIIEIGTITDDVTNVFEFDNKIYFINGHEYKVYNGTSLNDVVGYVPTIKESTTPLGIGVNAEQINLLNMKRKISYSPDGTSTTYHLAETDIVYIDEVKHNGLIVTGYTVNLAAGTVTFNNAPAQGTDTLEITYTASGSLLSNVTENKYCCLYGLSNDTRVFLYGSNTNKNRIIFSGLAEGVPSVEYFPANNFIDIGNKNYPVTDINRQYDRLIISKPKETYYSYYDSVEDTTGVYITTFPTYPLNNAHGMVAYGQGQVLNNNVVTIDSSIVEWVSTQTKDERNAQIISTRVQEWLNERDLSKAVTCDFQLDNEFWIAIDNEILIYNYGNSTFSMLKLPENVKTIYADEFNVYIGTTNVYMFDKELTTYDGDVIEAVWKSGFMPFGADFIRKTMRTVWLTLKPSVRNSLLLDYVTDRDNSEESKEIIGDSFIDFGLVDFNDMQFLANTSSKPHKVKIKAKKFTYLQLVLRNNKSLDKVLIDNISVQRTFGSYSK